MGYLASISITNMVQRRSVLVRSLHARVQSMMWTGHWNFPREDLQDCNQTGHLSEVGAIKIQQFHDLCQTLNLDGWDITMQVAEIWNQCYRRFVRF